MSAWLQRISLAKLGWRTEIMIDKMGVASDDPMDVRFGIWARRGHWGHALSDVCLHDTVCINLEDDTHRDLAEHAVDTVHLGCMTAMSLYPDTVPCQMPGKVDGKLTFAEHGAETDYMRKFVGLVQPTEKLVDDLRAYDGNHDFIDAVCDVARNGFKFMDSLDHHFGHSRMARDCADRDWGYRVRLAPHVHHGVAVSHNPIESTTRMLHETAVVNLARASAQSLRAYFDGFYHGMPPGFRSREEALADQRKHIEAADLGPDFEM